MVRSCEEWELVESIKETAEALMRRRRRISPLPDDSMLQLCILFCFWWHDLIIIIRWSFGLNIVVFSVYQFSSHQSSVARLLTLMLTLLMVCSAGESLVSKQKDEAQANTVRWRHRWRHWRRRWRVTCWGGLDVLRRWTWRRGGTDQRWLLWHIITPSSTVTSVSSRVNLSRIHYTQPYSLPSL